VKAADITDAEFVAAVLRVQQAEAERWTDRPILRWATWGYNGCDRPHLLAEFPEAPYKVLLAKARKVIKRGLVTGCACGCRGDFEVTAVGLQLLNETEANV
jgi:hypothetical protein